jgi:MerR family transcriptional regulator/heat shock protein HspR
MTSTARRGLLVDLFAEEEPDRRRPRDEPVYVISVAAELVGAHAQTLRHYERVGLIIPRRSSGNIRLYSDRDVERLRAIVRLTGELSVNLAGVELILEMRERMERLQDELDGLRREMRQLRGYVLEDRQTRSG